MAAIRVIPSLLIHKDGLVKSVRFKDYKYVGDPINAVKIFNDKEVDELVMMDIDATKENRSPNIARIAEIAGEAFMPVAYGGGITTVQQIKDILFNGIEKVIINKAAHTQPELRTEAAALFGSQTIVVSIDVKKNLFGRSKVYTDNGRNNTGIDPAVFAIQVAQLGAGEILLNSIDRDGTYQGYDLPLIKSVSDAVSIPVIAIGGASSVDDFQQAINNGASATAAGSMFVFQRPHQAVLISYPDYELLKQKLSIPK